MLLIAGPCVIEDEGLVLEVAQELKRQTQGLPVDLFLKASFDKANRSSLEGFRGPGLKEGLAILGRVRAKTGLRVLTDLHSVEQAEAVAETVDALQVPAFLCRQTDLIVAATQAALKFSRRLNLKKGQFLAPWDMRNLVEKVEAVASQFLSLGGEKIPERFLSLTERGVSFGYQTLVVDMISFQEMKKIKSPLLKDITVIYDVTHSIQRPGGGPGGKSSGGRRESLEPLARAAMAAGAQGLFMECHPQPERAKSDGANAFRLPYVGQFIEQLLAIRALVSGQPFLLPAEE